MIVWLASYPRSGNTYLRALLASLYGRRSLSRYSVGKKKNDNPANFWALPNVTSLQGLADADDTYLIKTHDLPGDDTFPAIYIVRDGRDALVSYAKHVLSHHGKRPLTYYPPDAMRTLLTHLILETQSPFGTWWQSVLAWHARPRTAIIRFEEMIQSPECVTRAVEQLGLGWSQIPGATVPSFQALQTVRPGNFQRGKVGGWQDSLPADLDDLFWSKCGHVLETFGYPRNPAKKAA